MKRFGSALLSFVLLLIFFSFPALAYEGDWARDIIHADAASTFGLDGTGVRIGIIDSGVNSEDLDASHVTRLSMRNDDGSDQYGHGTIVSGLIAGVPGNDLGVDGVAPGAEIISIKAFDGGESISLPLLADAIDLALSYDCDIINMSFGTPMDSAVLQAAIARATQNGVIVVAASGNAGTTQAYFPGAYPAVAGVGAVDSDGQVAIFSQRNPAGKQYTWLVAPGVSVYDGGYLSTTDSGSSFSCAFVTAAAALALQGDPSLTPYKFLTLLAQSAEDLGAAGFDSAYGYGLLRIDRMLALLGHPFAEPPFPDIAGTWYESAVLQLSDLNLFQGKGDCRFDGEAAITRAEFATVLVRALNLQEAEPNGAIFQDVPANAWFSRAVETACKYGVVTGRGDGTFAPNANITRQEAMVMIQRAAQETSFPSGSTDGLSSFSDVSQVSAWAKDAVLWNVGSGLIVGSGNLLRPLHHISRAETAVVLLRLLQKTGALVAAA